MPILTSVCWCGEEAKQIDRELVKSGYTVSCSATYCKPGITPISASVESYPRNLN